MRDSGKRRWSEIKAHLRAFDQDKLLAVVGELYRASSDNQRMLHVRFLGPASEIERYRRLITAAIYPDPFSRRPIRLGDAKRLIKQYARATGDDAGTVDLTLSFIEAGIGQAADLGFGDDAYFSTLTIALEDVERRVRSLPRPARQEVAMRLTRIAKLCSRQRLGLRRLCGRYCCQSESLD